MSGVAASIIVGAAHVVSAFFAYELALQFHQTRIAARAKEHRLIVTGTHDLLTAFFAGGIHIV